jgi:hypothetical protein
MPDIGYHVRWYGVWMEIAEGVSLENLLKVGWAGGAGLARAGLRCACRLWGAALGWPGLASDAPGGPGAGLASAAPGGAALGWPGEGLEGLELEVGGTWRRPGQAGPGWPATGRMLHACDASCRACSRQAAEVLPRAAHAASTCVEALRPHAGFKGPVQGGGGGGGGGAGRGGAGRAKQQAHPARAQPPP